ncbi:ChaN family lipoprotein [Jeongeupia naejangsanensis]|uniref:ChaN family lipoprotein n=1 Tax=Jeongeupia naejangsanensis TaxID=613195 RepID=A0ABS2BQK2_9NEIS|nr:ChaN family lipoprotein [Jeongeupia naejangsanensis]MBM3117907.1 ChaN family lipoprotein [Jeongeupia naejangsanensis]
MSRSPRTLLLALISAALLGACASTPSSTVTIPFADKRVVLLGEVHDNAAGHEARFAALKAAVDAGWRPVIAMEQFDRERQADLDAARKGGDADAVIKAAAPAKSSWNWTFYKPVIALALQYDLPLIAANVSRADAGKVVRGGYAAAFDPAALKAARLDAAPAADIVAGQQHEVEVGHCGKLPQAMVPGMAQAQIARDAFMAQVLRDNAQRGVVLIAGNGHVRADIGVPRWLAGVPASQVLSVGYLESDKDAKAFDKVVTIPAEKRPDPCATLG